MTLRLRPAYMFAVCGLLSEQMAVEGAINHGHD